MGDSADRKRGVHRGDGGRAESLRSATGSAVPSDHDKSQELVSNKNLSINNPPLNIVKQPVSQMFANELDSAVLNCDITKVSKKNAVHVVKWKKDGKMFRQVDINSPQPDLPFEHAMSREDCKYFMLKLSTVMFINSFFLYYFSVRITANRKNGSLIFVSVVTSDNGTYECETFNDREQQISSTIVALNVIEILKFLPQPPTSKNIELGTVAKVHCKVQGTPMPQITWTKVSWIFYCTRKNIAVLIQKIDKCFLLKS